MATSGQPSPASVSAAAGRRDAPRGVTSPPTRVSTQRGDSRTPNGHRHTTDTAPFWPALGTRAPRRSSRLCRRQPRGNPARGSCGRSSQISDPPQPSSGPSVRASPVSCSCVRTYRAQVALQEQRSPAVLARDEPPDSQLPASTLWRLEFDNLSGHPSDQSSPERGIGRNPAQASGGDPMLRYQPCVQVFDVYDGAGLDAVWSLRLFSCGFAAARTCRRTGTGRADLTRCVALGELSEESLPLVVIVPDLVEHVATAQVVATRPRTFFRSSDYPDCARRHRAEPTQVPVAPCKR